MEPKNVHLLNVKRAKGDTPRPRILDYLDAARANLAQLEAWRKQHKIDYAECAEQRDAALREVEHLKFDGEKEIDAVRDQLGQLQARQRQYVVDYAECEKQRDTALRDLDRSNEAAVQQRLLLEEYDSIIEAQSELIEELRAQNLREPNARARRDPGERADVRLALHPECRPGDAHDARVTVDLARALAAVGGAGFDTSFFKALDQGFDELGFIIDNKD